MWNDRYREDSMWNNRYNDTATPIGYKNLFRNQRWINYYEKEILKILQMFRSYGGQLKYYIKYVQVTWSLHGYLYCRLPTWARVGWPRASRVARVTSWVMAGPRVTPNTDDAAWGVSGLGPVVKHRTTDQGSRVQFPAHLTQITEVEICASRFFRGKLLPWTGASH